MNRFEGGSSIGSPWELPICPVSEAYQSLISHKCPQIKWEMKPKGRNTVNWNKIWKQMEGIELQTARNKLSLSLSVRIRKRIKFIGYKMGPHKTPWNRIRV
jgi:hypothetical protein